MKGYHFRSCRICHINFYTMARYWKFPKCRDCAERPELSKAISMVEYRQIKEILKNGKKENKKRKDGEIWDR